jgi:valyl-tRNA synthetase
VPASLDGLADAGLAGYEALVRSLTGLQKPADGFAPTASVSVRGARVDLDLSGAIDFAAERARLSRDIAAARKELQTATAKLDNADFVVKAPEPVVAKVRGRLAAAEADIRRLSDLLDALPSP